MPTLRNISILYSCPDRNDQSDVHAISNAALVWEKGKILWVGKEAQLPENYQNMGEQIDARGSIVTPGLIDCHTHLAFGGWRSDEFEMRLQGKSYLDIAKEGGGILSTVHQTRAADEEELFQKSLTLLHKISASGVTTIECKSGYGLTLKDELKQLRVYRRLQEHSRVRILSTFLGAHTIPPEYEENRKKYIDLLIHEMIPAVAEEKLAQFCDVFVEDSAFTVDEARLILEAGKKAGLKPKIHADQLTSCGGAELAAEVGAISADHLEHISDNGIRMMADQNVTAVTLPIASLYTHQPYLNCRRLIDGGVKVAVATDFNPGTAPTFDLELAMMLSCNHGRLTPSECLKGVTIHAARALGIHHITGSLEPGKKADFLLSDAMDINFWLYHYKGSSVQAVYIDGIPIHD
ncbi:MAG: imidazolonepropionase [Balneolaceae bacterium]